MPFDGSPDCGVGLLRERVRSIPALLEAWGASADAARAARPRLRPRRVVATGLGSSEAHARYLVWFLNRFTDIPAEFLPTGVFAVPIEPVRCRDRTLVVFSQGLSAAGRIALGRRGDFASTVLFTSATVEGLRHSGKTERLECLEPLEHDPTVEVVRFPPEDEFTLLIRVVGPALGFLAARVWAGGLVAGGGLCGDPRSIGAAAAQAFRAGREAGREAWPRMDRAAFGHGFVLLASPDLSEYLQNVVYKFVEGLFRPAPSLQELLQFAHGPFQQLTASPRPVVVVHRRCGAESDQLMRIRQMCRSACLDCLSTGSGLASPTDLLVFEAEGLFVDALLDGVEHGSVDQVAWPGRGMDGPLYDYLGSGPSAVPSCATRPPA